MSTQDVNEFLRAQGSKAFAFDEIGDAVSGEITAMDLRQQTDLTTNEPLFWNNGAPRMVMVLTLQTELHTDDGDDGARSVWCRGGNFVAARGTGTSSLTAVKDALRRAGATDIEIGGWMRMAYSGESKAERGKNPAKLYTAEYKAPKQAISLDELS